jgi:O-antigen/teichoic acid export membrane protein
MIIKDALWQIVGRLLSALGGFVVISLMTPYLGPLRFGDYSTILKYFAIRSALADFGLYVLAIKKL